MDKAEREVLQQQWVHSHEEDTDTEMVFRPSSYNFPRSRGRQGFELKADGSLGRTRVGPTDRREQSQGRWEIVEDDKLAFYKGSEAGPERVLEIASVSKDRLVVKKAT